MMALSVFRSSWLMFAEMCSWRGWLPRRVLAFSNLLVSACGERFPLPVPESWSSVRRSVLCTRCPAVDFGKHRVESIDESANFSHRF